jgi:hypothetical protein
VERFAHLVVASAGIVAGIFTIGVLIFAVSRCVYYWPPLVNYARRGLRVLIRSKEIFRLRSIHLTSTMTKVVMGAAKLYARPKI